MDYGQPIVTSLIRSMSVTPGSIVDIERIHRIQRILEVFKDILSFLVVIILIYLLGWGDNESHRPQFAGCVRQRHRSHPAREGHLRHTQNNCSRTFQQKPEGVERVVLVGYPSADVKSVGLVMRTFHDDLTNKEMAAVYMPIAPFLTSGNVTIVPVDGLVSTNWSVDEALKFIASGGTARPVEAEPVTPPTITDQF